MKSKSNFTTRYRTYVKLLNTKMFVKSVSTALLFIRKLVHFHQDKRKTTITVIISVVEYDKNTVQYFHLKLGS